MKMMHYLTCKNYLASLNLSFFFPSAKWGCCYPSVHVVWELNEKVGAGMEGVHPW